MSTLHTLLAVGLAASPLGFALAAVSPGQPPFRRLERAAALTLAFAGLGGLAWWRAGSPPATFAPALGLPGGDPGVTLDAVTFWVLGLIALIAVAVARYARSAFEGEARGRAAARWMAATLAFTAALATTSHLVVLLGAWAGASLSMHRLITQPASRPRAQLAAGEKFVVSRAAELAMAAAVALLGARLGTLTFDGIAAALAGGTPAQDGPLVAAAVLIAGAVVAKSAALPFHGWLTRVMEAPTPVSALLHAGVVNVGGVVLLRVAPLITEIPAARGLLLGFGAVTAIVAGLVITQRASVKAKLAWSTVAQMGFMLMECGLGAWSLALLHLVAHSCYKAHAFLTAGSAVRRGEALALSRPPRAIGLGIRGLAAAGGLGLTLGCGLWAGVLRADHPGELALAVVSGLGLATLLAEGAARRALPGAVATATAAALALAVWHPLFGAAVADAPTRPATAALLAASFLAAWAAHALLATRPEGPLARALAPHLAAGLHLDHPLLARVARRLPAARATPLET